MQKRYPETQYKKYITDDEKKLVEDFVNQNCIPQMRIAFKFMFKFGLRVSDACKVNVKDLDFVKKTVIIDQMKTRRIIELPMDEDLIQYLKSYITVFESEIQAHKGYLSFGRYKGHDYIDRHSFNNIWKKFRRSLGYTNPYYSREYEDGTKNPMYRLCNHVLRHYVINKVYTQTKDIRLACAVAGHSSPSVTLKHYFDRPTVEDLRIAMNQLR